MGDRDTREDAIRLATEAAKRNALEQVAVYLESITIVDGLDVTKDEIRTYTAGLVLVLEQQTNTTLEGDTIVVRTDLIAQIDTEEVRQAITALRGTRTPGINSPRCNRKMTNYNRTSTQRIRPWHKPRPQSRHSRRPSNAKTS